MKHVPTMYRALSDQDSLLSIACTGQFAKYWHMIYLVRAAVVPLQVFRWQRARSSEESTGLTGCPKILHSFGTFCVEVLIFHLRVVGHSLFSDVTRSILVVGYLWYR
jgi:hypothetical protein